MVKIEDEDEEDEDEEQDGCYGECMKCDCKLYDGEGEYCNNGSCDLCEDCYEKHYAKCEDCKKEDEVERMVDWKAGEFCCVDYKFRGRCECCNEEGRWVAVDKDEDGKDEEQICCFGCNSGIDEEE